MPCFEVVGALSKCHGEKNHARSHGAPHLLYVSRPLPVGTRAEAREAFELYSAKPSAVGGSISIVSEFPTQSSGPGCRWLSRVPGGRGKLEPKLATAHRRCTTQCINFAPSNKHAHTYQHTLRVYVEKGEGHERHQTRSSLQ